MGNLFFSRKIGRLLFLFRYAVVLSLLGVMAAIYFRHFKPMMATALRLDRLPPETDLWLTESALYILLALYLAYYFVYVVPPRLRSVGVSVWWTLILLIPSIYLHLLAFAVLLGCPENAAPRLRNSQVPGPSQDRT
jgi:uncharacterized membrane protein YhaH (DUF805 family)